MKIEIAQPDHGIRKETGMKHMHIYVQKGVPASEGPWLCRRHSKVHMIDIGPNNGGIHEWDYFNALEYPFIEIGSLKVES